MRMLMLASVASMIDQFNMPNIKMLLEMGCNVDVACNFVEGSTCSLERIKQLKRNLTELGVNCYQVDFSRDITKITRIRTAYKQVKTLMKSNAYNFVHCHSPVGGLIARTAGRATKTKVIYTAHGFHFYKGAPLKNWLMYYPVEWLLAHWTDTLITINREDYDAARKMPLRGSAYQIPGVGLDIDKFNMNQFNRSEYRKSLGIAETDFMIVSVGELNQNKNHMLVLESLARINDPKIHYCIAGTGPNQDTYRNFAQQHGMTDRVHLLGFRTDITELNHAADLFEFPSIREGLGMAALEALACGTPVCAVDNRGTREYVVNGETGYLHNNTVDDCVKKIGLIMDLDYHQRNVMCDACKRMAGRFSKETSSKNMMEIYRSEIN